MVKTVLGGGASATTSALEAEMIVLRRRTRTSAVLFSDQSDLFIGQSDFARSTSSFVSSRSSFDR